MIIRAQLTAAKKAADDAIAALPATAKITSADKDAFKNAYDLAEAYNELVKSTTGTKGTLALPANKVSALQAAIQGDFNLAYAKADKTDKATLKAIAADVAVAEEELVDSGLMSNSFVDPTTAALAKIRAAEKQAVIDAIKAIPMNVTEADKAVVEKARALYDAYVAEYTDYDLGKDDNDAGYVVKEFEAYYHDLALAEATLGLNEDPAKDVEALKITASSTAKKGSITVKWRVKGDTSAVEGYEIWRSTKKSSGYSKFFTTTNLTYKNTKSLKKGTRYYYKVRAYAYIDGVKVTSDWSNKAYRIAK